jgi:hypothetical protein
MLTTHASYPLSMTSHICRVKSAPQHHHPCRPGSSHQRFIFRAIECGHDYALQHKKQGNRDKWRALQRYGGVGRMKAMRRPITHRSHILVPCPGRRSSQRSTFGPGMVLRKAISLGTSPWLASHGATPYTLDGRLEYSGRVLILPGRLE